jgi:hypothetical protein
VHRRVDPNLLADELLKVARCHQPPLPVKATLTSAESTLGLLFGWRLDEASHDPPSRGLVLVVREYAPGLTEDWLGWLAAERIELL